MTTPLQPIEVLLVEDDPGDELMTREAFEENRIGNRLHVARDGEEALDFLYQRGEHAQAPPVDLILLDLNLPKYDGRQVLEQIRSDPGLTHTPVVILTTSSSEEDIMRSYKLHANAFVTKPVDVNRFIAAVRQIDEFFLTVVRLPRPCPFGPADLIPQQPDDGGLECAVGGRPAGRHAGAQPVHREPDRLAVQVPVDQPGIDVGGPAHRRRIAEVRGHLRHDPAHRALAGRRRRGRVAGHGQPDRGQDGGVPGPQVLGGDVLAAEQISQVVVHAVAV